MVTRFAAWLALFSGVSFASLAAETSKDVFATNQVWPPSLSDRVVNISGNYPHLTVFNSAGECGIGAVASWAGKLWFMTYPPHKPEGSDDKLYSLDPNLKLEIRPESVGGTHANRMFHQESGQLIIGPYFIDAQGNVRVADIHQLRARLTATTRHLTDPTNKVFYVGMERELYEVDVHSLAVKRIYGESRGPFPGTHGKGAYVSQGRLIVADNGEPGWSFSRDPQFNAPAGCLAETDGKDWQRKWTVLERKNFCEVTGPGGLSGNSPDADRVWATGWDKRSVLLKLLDQGQWRTYRLPKASYSHDALHGWYTEWPRIRELMPGTRLMHMHGLFYLFPGTFSLANTGGLRPLSSYLKMPVDYCWWQNQIVMARDDASIMQNPLAGQSHSSLWFGQLADLEKYGPPAGWGGPWLDDNVKARENSDPFLVAGFSKRVLHLRHQTEKPVEFTVEVDADGRNDWKKAVTFRMRAQGYSWYVLPPEVKATWVRLRTDRDAAGVTAYWHLGNPPTKSDPNLFKALAEVGRAVPSTPNFSDGIIKPGQGDARTLIFAANTYDQTGAIRDKGYYEINGSLKLQKVENPNREEVLRTKFGVGKPEFTVDAASVIIFEGPRRYRLPKSVAEYDRAFPSGWPRGRREVVTERNLFNAHGTFYEVPRLDAGGFQRMRPVSTHNKRISDFCRWRGLLVLAGVEQRLADDHFYGSTDGKAGLWFGDVDDLWRLGPPSGQGGPWKNTDVTPDVPSDPYLMAGYDRKNLELSHNQSEDVTFTVEVDFLADGSWSEYARFIVPPGKTFEHTFPEGYSAHWVRLKANSAAKVTALFRY